MEQVTGRETCRWTTCNELTEYELVKCDATARFVAQCGDHEMKVCLAHAEVVREIDKTARAYDRSAVPIEVVPL